MPDWNAIEKSFLRIGRQQQLGELASALSRFKGWLLLGSANREVASVILDESILYVSLLIKEGMNSEFNELHSSLLTWRGNWSTITEQEAEMNKISQTSANWSEKVLDMSGLLSRC